MPTLLVVPSPPAWGEVNRPRLPLRPRPPHGGKGLGAARTCWGLNHLPRLYRWVVLTTAARNDRFELSWLESPTSINEVRELNLGRRTRRRVLSAHDGRCGRKVFRSHDCQNGILAIVQQRHHQSHRLLFDARDLLSLSCYSSQRNLTKV